MNRIILLAALLFTNFTFSQTEISWKHLEDVEFSDVYMEEVDEFVLFPYFGTDIFLKLKLIFKNSHIFFKV